MAAEPTRRAIVVGPKAHELRRYVGSASWAVLEEMMQVATGPSDRLVAEVSIRSLAASLGLAKDTVARAVRRLRDLGVIEADQRRAVSGVFQTGVYRLAVPTACLTVAPTTTPAAPTWPPASRERTTRRTTGQLALTLDA
ncbi:MAG: winged helix-turn-helix transcriptional regulator [Acidimicrobiales bacterium]